MWNRSASTLVLATLLTAVPMAGAVLAQAPKDQPKEKAMDKPADAKEVVMPNGLKYTDLKVGEGDEAKTGQIVSVHYTGWLTNGTKFDSSLDRKQAFSFKLGAGQVIEGWDKGVAGMKVGGKRKLTIPPGLGYGSQSVGGVIPPNSTLVFDVELLGVKNP
ncbi:MAG TPA: FKBP-type peptidyl-prolyl cis-trans isomerase [Thermoanaerobaculia bacterium]|nr:FKBP-type peptidyl-prolyl cis-trans isomerase [Thermoanaerobaculia bacterium]